MIAVDGVNADGHREILGIDVATAGDGAGGLAFLRSLITRGLAGVQLVASVSGSLPNPAAESRAMAATMC